MGGDKLEGIEVRNGERGSTIRIRFMYLGCECRETLKLEASPANLGDALNDGIITANPLDRIDLSNDAQILRIPLLMLL